ncbi:MAG: flagellin [Allorhizobium sp.]
MTNNAAISAMDILRDTYSSRAVTQGRVTTGYRVAEASDNSAYWSIATTMRSDSKVLAAVEDALSLGSAIVDTAGNGISSASDILSQFKSRLVLAREPGVDRGKINIELSELKEQMKTITHASTFSGENFVWRTNAADDGERALVGSFQRNADGGVTITNMSYDIDGVAGTSKVNYLIDDVDGERGILTGSGFATELGTSKTWVLFNGEGGTAHDEMTLSDATTNNEIEEMISVVDAMAERAIDVGSTIGALATRITLQHEFVVDLQDSLAYGVGRMVDADMNEESARLKAVETREKLGMQALAIANNGVGNFLALLQS